MDLQNQLVKHVRIICLIFSILNIRTGQYIESIPEDLTNVAVEKPSWMASRDARNGIASRGNDGDTRTSRDFCAFSAFGSKLYFQWWRVDLLNQHKIWYADVTSVGDCCAFSLGNFEIRVAARMAYPEAALQTSHSEKVCAKQVPGQAPGTTRRLHCRHAPVTGRYVTLLMRSDKTRATRNNIQLVLCELAIYAPVNNSESVMEFGANCSLSSCPGGLVCGTRLTKKACYVPAGGSCRGDYRDSCEDYTFCSRDGMCRVKALLPCSDILGPCELGAECDGKCTFFIESTCDDNPKKCTGFDRECDYAKRCGVDRYCRFTYECKSGSVCIKNTCNCTKGTQGKAASCAPSEGQVGGNCSDSCEDPNAECHAALCRCKKGYSMERTDYTCGLAPGEKCWDNKQCPTGSVCDIGGECRLIAGQSCQGESRFHCRIGTVCDLDYVCRINVHQDCNGNNPIARKLCRLDSFCDITDRCRLAINVPCLESEDCVTGGECVDGACKCKSARIHPDPSFLNYCATREEMSNVSRHCKNDTECEEKHRCNIHQGVCECDKEYRLDTEMKCRLLGGQTCSNDEECVMCSICQHSKCKYKLGCKCVGDTCVDGAVCDEDDICRLGLGTACGTADKDHLCVRHSMCDYQDKRCRLLAGGDCTRHGGQCPMGSSCQGGVCACYQRVTKGTTCLADEGTPGGPCYNDKCLKKQATCGRDDLCHCPPGDFYNLENSRCDEEKNSRPAYVMVVAILGAIMFLLAIIGMIGAIAWVACFKKTRNKKPSPSPLRASVKQGPAFTTALTSPLPPPTRPLAAHTLAQEFPLPPAAN